MSRVIKRIQRIDDLLRAQYFLLDAVHKNGDTIKAGAGRYLAHKLVVNQSRGESVWTTVINAGYLQPRGGGEYALTEFGKSALFYWDAIFNPPNEVFDK